MRQSGYTLQEIGDYAGVTRERVRQLLFKHCGNIEILMLAEKRVAEEIDYPLLCTVLETGGADELACHCCTHCLCYSRLSLWV